MAFNLDVGTDLYGNKHNLQLKFNHGPSLAEVAAAVETGFDVKARSTRPAGYPDQPFKIETFQIFDDTLLRWVDLYDARQLKPGGQLWCFQPESIWHSDAQGVIPDSEKTVATITNALGSPRRARIAADAGVPPTLSEKLRSVFFQVDGTNKGYLLYDDLQRAFQRCDMEFTAGTAGDLFNLADQNRSQHITYDEWVNFAIQAPGVVDAIFFRMRDLYQDRLPSGHPQPTVEHQAQRQSELQDMYNQQWATEQRSRQEAEFNAERERQARLAREKEEAARAADQHARDAQTRAEELARQAAAADAQAQAAASQLQAAQTQAHNAAAAHQQAQSQAQQAAAHHAETERAASVRRAYSATPPPAQGGYAHVANPAQSSPERDNALREYEAARRRADEVRLAKEEAEREERNAWDRCYYAPASPHYGPGSRGY